MKKTIIFFIVLLGLLACSKKTILTASDSSASVTTNTVESSINKKQSAAQNNAFFESVKQDFAKQFVTEAAEACARQSGDKVAVPNSGASIHYLASGTIEWGDRHFDYVKASDAKITFTNSVVEKTFTLSIDIHQSDSGKSLYVSSLTQLHGDLLNATVTDETQSEPASNLCVGSAPPVIARDGAWNLAVKYMQFKPTKMSCAKIASVDISPVEFAFDGAEIHAGYNTFSKADAQHSESFFIDPASERAPLIYQVNASEGRSVTIGINDQNILVFAAMSSADEDELVCSPVK